MPPVEVLRTDEFDRWVESLRDWRARAHIVRRIGRMEVGLLGDVKSVGGRVSEARIDYGPGYRIYFTRRGRQLVLLLCGGDKSSQARDIKRAMEMAETLED